MKLGQMKSVTVMGLLTLLAIPLQLSAQEPSAQLLAISPSDPRQSLSPALGRNTWRQGAELTASDGAPSDMFGNSVSISGDTVVVGSFNSNNHQGAAYVFVRAAGATNMIQRAKLIAPAGAFAKFGSSVSISGDTIVVGAPSQPVLGDSNSDNSQGAAYVFVKPAGGWTDMTPRAKLTASNGAPGDFMGLSVGISDNTIVVGANRFDAGGMGAAYVFVEPNGGWRDMTETAVLAPPDDTWKSEFGGSVSISRDAVVVGAPFALVDNRYQGAAYVFVKPQGGWTSMMQVAKLTASNAPDTSNFGFSVSVSGNTVMVGNPDEVVGGIQNQGAAYIFVEPAGGWRDMTQTAKLTLARSADGDAPITDTLLVQTPAADNFGWSVFVGGNTILVGAPGHNDGAGAAYLFQKPASGWNTPANFSVELSPSNGEAGNADGQSVSVSENTVVTGAFLATVGNNSQQGAAYLFDSNPVSPGNNRLSSTVRNSQDLARKGL